MIEYNNYSNDIRGILRDIQQDIWEMKLRLHQLEGIIRISGMVDPKFDDGLLGHNID